MKRFKNGFVCNFNVIDATTNKEVLKFKGRSSKEFKTWYKEVFDAKF